MDIDTIAPGTDFTEEIERAVASSDAFLALIGKRWLTATDAQGRRRLDNPEDYVRLEIEAALESKLRVIPVLLQGAEMPSSDQLPSSLAKLARIQAQEVSDGRWNYDISRLISALEKAESQKLATAQAVEPPPRREEPAARRGFMPRRRALLVGAAVVALAILAVLVALLFRGGEPDESGGGRTTPTTEDQPQSQGDSTAGKEVFASSGCAACHTLAAAGSSGTIGPNLDELKPSHAQIVEQVTNGGGVMPPFEDELSEQEIQDVAAFVFTSTQ